MICCCLMIVLYLWTRCNMITDRFLATRLQFHGVFGWCSNKARLMKPTPGMVTPSDLKLILDYKSSIPACAKSMVKDWETWSWMPFLWVWWPLFLLFWYGSSIKILLLWASLWPKTLGLNFCLSLPGLQFCIKAALCLLLNLLATHIMASDRKNILLNQLLLVG